MKRALAGIAAIALVATPMFAATAAQTKPAAAKTTAAPKKAAKPVKKASKPVKKTAAKTSTKTESKHKAAKSKG